MKKQLTCIQLVSLKLPDFITDQWCYRRNQSTVNKKWQYECQPSNAHKYCL